MEIIYTTLYTKCCQNSSAFKVELDLRRLGRKGVIKSLDIKTEEQLLFRFMMKIWEED